MTREPRAARSIHAAPTSHRPTIILAIALVTVGCAGERDHRDATSGNPAADRRAEQHLQGDDAAERQSLFDRLGGDETIAAIVDDWVERSVADPRTNFSRAGVRTGWLGKTYDTWPATGENLERLKRNMRNFIALAAGGPAVYAGGDIKAVHSRMGITNNEFDAMVGDLKAAMDRIGVERREQRDLLAIVETTRKQVVEER